MNRIIFSIVLCVITLTSWGQAKKPVIMIVPSDIFCVSHGYTVNVNANGKDEVLPDYKKAMQGSDELRMVITKMGAIMTERGFPLKDLEQTLKSIDTQSAEISMMTSKSSSAAIKETPIDILKRTAKADIIMDIDFNVKRQGPNNYITFVLKGLDAYTNKQVAAATGTGKPSSSATADLLLEEAVLSHMDAFNGQLTNFFNDMFTNGREVTIALRFWDNAGVDFEHDFDYKGTKYQLSFHIENWFTENTVSGRFSTIDATATMMKFEQVRIPMMFTLNGREVAMDTRRYISNLSKFLAGPPFNLDNKIYQRGLGEAWLIIGEK
jgi:hypothetical protein